MLLTGVDLTFIDVCRGKTTLRDNGKIHISADANGQVDISCLEDDGSSIVVGRTRNSLKPSDIDIAFLYKCAALMRALPIEEPLDLTPEAVDEAHRYFRHAGGGFWQRAQFLGLIR
jgi:hypothetical protein